MLQTESLNSPVKQLVPTPLADPAALRRFETLPVTGADLQCVRTNSGKPQRGLQGMSAN